MFHILTTINLLLPHSVLYVIKFLKKYFNDYIITDVPIFPPLTPPPSIPHSLWQPHCLVHAHGSCV